MLAAMTAAPQPPVIRRIAIDDDRSTGFTEADCALALAAQAWPLIERPIKMAAVERLVTEGRASELVLVSAYRQSRLCGAVLGQILPGRAAIVWLPQVASGEPCEIAIELVSELHHRLSAAGAVMAQALMEKALGDAAQILRSAGYQSAGEVLSMAAEQGSFPDQAPRLNFELERYSPSAHHRLVQVIENTYRGSLDCPLVNGLRDAADALAGYQAAGPFRPELWLLARNGVRDIGCLLLADHPAHEQLEIVYQGVTPEQRGRGWGLALTRHAQWVARQTGRARVVLAVDSANRPAIAAYEAAGFVGWDRRWILIHFFRSTAKPDAQST